MPLTPCPDCGNEMSTSAYVCPKCGRPNKTLVGRNFKKVMILWGVLIVAFVVIWNVLNTGAPSAGR